MPKLSALPTLTTNMESLLTPNTKTVIWPSVLNCFKDEYDALPDELKKLYVYNKYTNAYDIPDETWAKGIRQHGFYFADETSPYYLPYTIGGSDIGAIYDGSIIQECLTLYEGQHGSKYKNALELAYEKQGKVFTWDKKEKKPVLDVLTQGHVEEQSIRDYFSLVWNAEHPGHHMEVINDTHMYQCGIRDENGNLKYPYIICNTDGKLILDDSLEGIIECKTCQWDSPDKSIWKSGMVPLGYFLQCHLYLICTNRSFAYICVKFGLGDIAYIYVERDPDIDELLLDAVTEFMDVVKSGREPDISKMSPENVERFWRKASGPYDPEAKPVELPETLVNACIEINTLNEQIDIFSEKVEELKKARSKILVDNEIFTLVGKSNAATITLDDSHYMKLKFKDKPKGLPINEEKLKAEKPEIYEKYVEEKTEFNSSLFRKEQKKILNDYLLPDDNLTTTKMNLCDTEIVELKKKAV